ncbi:MAG TPA: maleylacetoacetate isomerase [Alphaproteobacteria bacterium]|nr:maleylacetoacetate isomerase [Alphaproteobacteria bacterium]
MKFYSYANSSAAYRVRIALNLKGLRPDTIYVSLLKDGGEQRKADYLAVNPQGLVPAFVHDGLTIGQSLAIIEYLEEAFPTPSVMPRDARGRARVRQIALAIACDIHPLNNLSVRQYLKAPLGQSDAEIASWYRHWIERGFIALETLLSQSQETGRFAHGDLPTLADICLVPQMYNARRYKVPLDDYPTLVRIDEEARALKAFADAAPEVQPDAGA